MHQTTAFAGDRTRFLTTPNVCRLFMLSLGSFQLDARVAADLGLPAATAHASDRSPLDQFLRVLMRELSTFIGAGVRAQFRLLISNSLDLPRHRPTHLDDNSFGAVLLPDLQDLDPSFFERWARLVAERRPVPPPRKTPRPDQLEAVDAICSRFAAGDTRLQLIAACATGKTLTALWVVERLDARRVIVFCPSLALVHQTLKAWSDQADPSASLDALVVCSDVSVGDVHPSELPIPVTTNGAAIRQFWQQSCGRQVLLSTYQRIDAVRDALSGADAADLLIANEAHRLAGWEENRFRLCCAMMWSVRGGVCV